MVDIRFCNIRLYKFKYLMSVWIIKYLLLVHIASAGVDHGANYMQADGSIIDTIGEPNNEINSHQMVDRVATESQNKETSAATTATLTPTTFTQTTSTTPTTTTTSTSTTTSTTTASGPVIGINYMEVQSYTANVTWLPPSKPNGYITGYLVEVALQNTAGCVYYIIVDEVELNDTSLPNCNSMNDIITSIDIGYNLELPNLKPYRNYTVTVRAVSEIGLGDPATVTFQTDISAPNDISELMVNSVRDESTQKVNLNISWIPGEQTGPTDYYILVEALGLDDGGSDQSINSYIVTGYNSNTYVKHDVLAYWSYSICVWAQTNKENSSWNIVQHTTVETNPGAVQNLSVTQDSPAANIVTLTFECPDRMSRNGIIEKFVITQTLLNPQTSGKNETIKYNHSATETSCTSEYKVIAQNIMVERNYSFSVMTVNNKYEGGISKYPRLYVQPKVPQLSNLQELFGVPTLVKLQKGSSHEQTKISIDICSTCLTDARWGRVVNVGILVCVKDLGKCTAPGRKKRSGPQFTSFKSWGAAKKEGFVSEYCTTPDNWIPTTNGTNSYTKFVIGEDTSCSEADEGYCNGPLPGGDREYLISVIMCTTQGCTVHRENQPFRTYASDSEPSQVGVIVGGVLGGLAVVAVIAVSVILIRMKQSMKETIRETIRETRKEISKNPDTQDTRANTYIPRQVASQRMPPAQLRDYPHIYDEVDYYDHIRDDTVRSSMYYQRHIVRQDVRSREHFYMDVKDSMELKFPYENEIPLDCLPDYDNY